MSREEFLKQLEMLLSGISEEERADAMAFYRSYFEDAGEGNEAAIMEELGSPQKVAESIRKNLGIDGNGGYYNTFAARDAEYYKNVNQTINNLGNRSGNEKKKDNTIPVVLGVVLAVVTSPIWLTLLIVVLSVLLAVVATLFGVAVTILAVMAALVFTGIFLLGMGIGLLFGGGPAVGLALIGAGLIVLAIGILAVVLSVWVFGGFLPWALKGIWNLCKKPFDKRRERAKV